MRRALRTAAWMWAALACAAPARAWIYSEHRAITARGIDTLDPRRRPRLDALWVGRARGSFRPALRSPRRRRRRERSPRASISRPGPRSPATTRARRRSMLATILDSDWILPVAAIGERIGEKIAPRRGTRPSAATSRSTATSASSAPTPTTRTRAGAGNAHFLLPRGVADPKAYAARGPARRRRAQRHRALRPLPRGGAASRGAWRPSPRRERAARMPGRSWRSSPSRLHFLEDAFAAGHIAGSWGNAAERKGTHDYYNEHGLDAETWNGTSRSSSSATATFTPSRPRAGGRGRPAEPRSRFSTPATAGIGGARGVGLAAAPPEVVAAGDFDRLPRGARCRTGPIPKAMRPVPDRGARRRPRFRFAARASRRCRGSAPRSARSSESPAGVRARGRGRGLRRRQRAAACRARSTWACGSASASTRCSVDAGDGLVFVQGGIVSQSRSSGSCEPALPERSAPPAVRSRRPRADRASRSGCACRSGSSRATSSSPRRCSRSPIRSSSRRWPSPPPTAA